MAAGWTSRGQSLSKNTKEGSVPSSQPPLALLAIHVAHKLGEIRCGPPWRNWRRACTVVSGWGTHGPKRTKRCSQQKGSNLLSPPKCWKSKKHVFFKTFARRVVKQHIFPEVICRVGNDWAATNFDTPFTDWLKHILKGFAQRDH